jgi:hypothetical protein
MVPGAGSAEDQEGARAPRRLQQLGSPSRRDSRSAAHGVAWSGATLCGCMSRSGYAKALDHAQREHGVGDLNEPGDVGARDVVAR